MHHPPAKKYPFIIYLIKFIGIFSILYFGTIGFIGLAAPGGYYLPFFDHYFNYVSWLRSSLMYGARAILSFAGFETYVKGIYTLQMQQGRGVHVGFDCLGYGVLSFWAAFIMANPGTWKKIAIWLSGGLLLIWCINVLRISLVLIALNKHWSGPLGLDHHSWFNIAAYSVIFTMIYLFDKAKKKEATLANTNNSKTASIDG